MCMNQLLLHGEAHMFLGRTHYKKTLLYLLGMVFLVACLYGVFTAYRQSVHEGMQREVASVMKEVNFMAVKLLRERLQNCQERIEQIASFAASTELGMNDPHLLEIMQELTRRDKIFSHITTVNLKGDCYEWDGSILLNIAARPYYEQGLRGSSSISAFTTSYITGREIIVIIAPVFRKGQIVGLVRGKFHTDELKKELYLSSFDNTGYSYLAKATGEVLLRSEHPDADQGMYNLLTDLFDTSLPQTALAEMLNNMRHNGSGTIDYTWKGTHRLMSYAPVGVNDWYLLTVAPQYIIAERTTHALETAVYLSAALTVCFLLALFLLRRRHAGILARLSDADQRIHSIYNAIPGGVFRCRGDDQWTVLYANDGFYRFTGYTRTEFTARFQNRLRALCTPEDAAALRKRTTAMLEMKGVMETECRILCAGDNLRWVWLNAKLQQDADGENSLYCTFLDISPLKKAQEELRMSEQRYAMVMEQTQDIAFECDWQTRHAYHSRNFQKKFGYAPIAHNYPQGLLHGNAVHQEDAAAFQNIFQQLENGANTAVCEARITTARKGWLWCRVSVMAVRNEQNKLTKVVGVISDIDRQKKEYEQTRILYEQTLKMAMQDSLTRLCNRGATENNINARLAAEHEHAALMLIDADNFKAVNDTLGHLQGDAVLIAIADGMRQYFNADDILGRIGGDEFVVLTTHVENMDNLRQLTDGLMHRLAGLPALSPQDGLTISVSVGVARVPEDGDTYATLLGKADAALYAAKKTGKNRWELYQPGMTDTPASPCRNA